MISTLGEIVVSTNTKHLPEDPLPVILAHERRGVFQLPRKARYLISIVVSIEYSLRHT